MIDNLSVMLSVRSRLLTLEVAATPDLNLGYDGTEFFGFPNVDMAQFGFIHGMEVNPVGFVDNGPRIVDRVTATGLKVITGNVTADSPAVGRRLVVGLPDHRAWENVAFTPEEGRWFVEEDYLPGVPSNTTIGPNGILDIEPVYVLRLYGLSGRGVGALFKVSDAILRLFFPGAAFPTNDGHTVRVGTSPAPYAGKIVPWGASHAVMTITIPLWVRTTNIS